MMEEKDQQGADTLCSPVFLGKAHYLLYSLVPAMQPRMLVTFDEDLSALPVSVRVGQVGAAGVCLYPKFLSTCAI